MDIRPTSTTAPAPAPIAIRGPGPSAVPASTINPATDSSKADEVTAPAAPAPGKEELAHALKSINSALQDRSPGLEFSIDSASDRSVVKVVDKDTHEVIRQMPSREAMEIAQALDKLQSLLVRETA